mgnify:FL=1
MVDESAARDADDEKYSDDSGDEAASDSDDDEHAATEARGIGGDADGQRRARQRISYAVYIYKVLKQVHPDTGISKKAMCVVDSMINDVFERIAREAGQLARYSGSNTITSREIQTAVRLILPGAIHEPHCGSSYCMYGWLDWCC